MLQDHTRWHLLAIQLCSTWKRTNIKTLRQELTSFLTKHDNFGNVKHTLADWMNHSSRVTCHSDLSLPECEISLLFFMGSKGWTLQFKKSSQLFVQAEALLDVTETITDDLLNHFTGKLAMVNNPTLLQAQGKAHLLRTRLQPITIRYNTLQSCLIRIRTFWFLYRVRSLIFRGLVRETSSILFKATLAKTAGISGVDRDGLCFDESVVWHWMLSVTVHGHGFQDEFKETLLVECAPLYLKDK